MAINIKKLETKLKEWQEVAQTLSCIKKLEADLRTEIADIATEGKTGKFKKNFIVDGIEYTINCATSLSIDKNTFDYDSLLEDSKSCFTIEYKLNKKALTSCNNEHAVKEVNNVLIEKPSMPTIKIKGQEDE